MHIAVIQFAASTDVDANIDAIRAHGLAAASAGAELIVVPEASMHDFGPPDLPLGPVAQRIDGPFASALGELARETQATLVAGMFECSDDPARPFNTLVAVGPEGAVSHHYRKAHLYDSFGYRESDRLTAGEPAPVVIALDGLSVGLMTCYDLRFPEFTRLLVDAGADVLAVPAAWVRGPLKEDHWMTLLRARAIENTAYVAGAAQTGRHYVGRSAIVDPMGVPIACLGDEPGYAAADALPERLREVRRCNPALAHRRLRIVR